MHVSRKLRYFVSDSLISNHFTEAPTNANPPFTNPPFAKLLGSTERQTLAYAQASSSRINAVNEMAAAINQILDRDEILAFVGKYARWLLDFDQCALCVEADDKLNYTVLHGERFAGFSPFDSTALGAAKHDGHPIRRALALRQPQLVAELQTPGEDLTYRSMVVVPLVDGGRVLGALIFAARAPQAYGHQDVRIAGLMAQQVAVALGNAQRFAEVNRLYAELQRTYKELRRAERMRDDFTNMIVHDLRSPLTAVVGSLNLAQRMIDRGGPVPPSLFERANSASEQIGSMINTMLDVSKLEAGKMTLHQTPTDMRALIREHADLYWEQAAAEERCLTIQIADSLPLVCLDAKLIERTLDNLVHNALKFTKRNGQIDIDVTLHEQMLQIAVTDNGPGIPADQRERIFDKFAQVESAFARRGTGLGLTFCRLAVEAHGGRIWVEQAPSQGSRFLFTLPLADETC